MKSNKVLILGVVLLLAALLLMVCCPMVSQFALTKYGDDSVLRVGANIANLLAGFILLASFVVLPVGIYRAFKASAKKP